MSNGAWLKGKKVEEIDFSDGTFDDSGQKLTPSGGAGGSVATDTIWNAKGDLAAGTGPDAAAVLSVGVNDRLLIADSAQVSGLRWATAAEVRAAIALVVGTNVQAWDADLDTYAGITPSANVQSLLGSATYSAMRTLLSLVPGTDVQAVDATLTALAAANWAANALPIGTGADTLAQTAFAANTFPARASTGNLVAKTISDAALSVLDDVDVATMRATLGVIASLFQSGGAQALALDTLAAPTDIETLNASTTAHGLLKKLSNAVADVMSGTGTWVKPPGYEFDYAEVTSSLTIAATTEATADIYVSGAAVAYDGSTVIIIECFIPWINVSTSTGANIPIVVLFDGSSAIGRLTAFQPVDSTIGIVPVGVLRRKLTPSNASHTYSIRAFKAAGSGTQSLAAGAGGSAAYVPGYIRQTKA